MTTQITVETLTRTINEALRNAPADRLRIERAAVLIATGKVQRTASDEWTVGSQNNPSAFYVVTPTTCACTDFARRQLPCKHLLATWITRAATRRQEIADAAGRKPRFPGLSAQELHRLSEFKAKYRAEVA